MTSLDNGPDIGHPGGNARGRVGHVALFMLLHVCSVGSVNLEAFGLGFTENPEAKSFPASSLFSIRSWEWCVNIPYIICRSIRNGPWKFHEILYASPCF